MYNLRFRNIDYIPQRGHINTKSGQAIITATVLFLFISTTIILGVSAPIYKEVRTVRDSQNSKSSYFASESGQEDVVYRLRTGLQLSTTEIITLNNIVVTTDINDVLGGKEITSSADNNSLIRKLQVNLIDSTGIAFNYGVQVGDGGLEMDSSSRVEGVGGAVGNVYSNGPIMGSTGATITGDAIVGMSVTADFTASSTVCNTDQIVGKFDPEIDFAQSFIPSVSELIGKVSLYIKKVGDPKDRDVRIVADNGGVPADDDIEKGKLKKSLVGTEYSWVDITFKNPPSVTAGLKYWIILDAKKDTNKYWLWCEDSSEGYGDGSSLYSKDWDDDPWIPSSGDLTFQIFVGTGENIIEDVDVLGVAKANTIKDSFVGGDAYYQTLINTDVGGTLYPGSPESPLAEMPISDGNITDWKNEAGCGSQPATGACAHSGDYVVDDNVSIGPLTITGDLDIQQNSLTITLTGIVYVQGNIDIDNLVTIECDSSYGSGSCLLITDGWIHVDQNGEFKGSGTAGSHLMILSTLDCDGSGAQSGCSHHDGVADLHNNSSGAVFYVPNGMVNLHNGANVTAVTAYKLRLDNGATVTYETGLINTQFSAGPSGGWDITDWKEIE